ncbi:MAG: hypothetical protein QHJ73_11335 [Armatimonadota bacterium]|nr:hypothetical protein [Armatimonadota bacterium]
MNPRERELVRDLARRYREIALDPVQEERRRLWRRQNSLKGDRPLIYVRAFAWSELPDSRCECTDPFLRAFENHFRQLLFWHSLHDDSIFEPWVTVTARHRVSGWGVAPTATRTQQRGSYKLDYPLKSLDDVEKLQPPRHEIDEEATARAVARTEELLGDILTVNVDRKPAWWLWSADLSTDLGKLRGIENFMLDMHDNPDGLHRLLKFMSEGVLRAHQQAEAAGDWGLCAHYNQAMPYSEELPDPAPNVNGVRRKQLWGYMAAQEFTLVSPAMHEEFLLRYQLPILKEFGLTAYGCCEDLTNKISMLRQIPNLRRIGVSPMANVARCAEQIGRDYVLSYRPSPTDMVGYGWNEERVRSILRRDLTACRGCHVDITLKDVETVQCDRDRPRKWVEVTRSVIDEVYG